MGDKPVNTEEMKAPGIVQICILFSATIALFIFIGYRLQESELYSGLLITEFGLIMLPALMFLIAGRYDMRRLLRLNGTRLANFPLIVGIMLFAVPLAALFNLLNLMLVYSIFGKVIVQPLPVAKNGPELLVSLAIIAGSAGLCEEFLFRGVLQRGFERFGKVNAILIAALLFSFTHLDFQKVFGTFLLGALIGFIVFRTNSLYSGMFAHFINNALAVLASYFSTKAMQFFQKTVEAPPSGQDITELFSAFSALPPEQLIFTLLVYGFMFLFAAVVFILLLFIFTRTNPAREKINIPSMAAMYNIPGGRRSGHIPGADARGGAAGLLWLLPGVLLIAVVFYVQMRGFMGERDWFTELFRRIAGV